MTREPEPVYKHFGALVRSHRSRRGMSQEALGATLVPKMTRASIANIEAGSQRVFLHTALRLAEVLQIALAEALSGEGPRPADSATLASELKDKLPVSSTRARSLARKVSGEQSRETE